MKTKWFVPIGLALAWCSCSPDGSHGNKVITQDQAHTACVKFLYNRGYTEDLRIVSERINDKAYTYRFMTNGVEVNREVVVDRHTGRAELK